MPAQSLELASLPSWLVLSGMAVLGGIVGSFLNVVAYRVPRRMSIARPGSRCPTCEQAIRWYDNVPVLSWLWLGGHCRMCGTSISPRYPAVELFTACWFAGLAYAEIFSEQSTIWSQEWVVADGPFNPWLMLAYHLVVGCTLIVAALIELDGFTPPPRLLGGVLIAGLIAPLFWPGVRPLGVAQEAVLPTGPVVKALLTGLAGAGAGLLLAGLLWPALGKPEPEADVHSAAIVALPMVGAFVGWQVVAAVGLLTTVLLAMQVGNDVARRRAGGALKLSLALAPATICVLLALPVLTLVLHRLDQSQLLVFVATCGLVAIGSIVLRFVRRRLAVSR